MTEAQPVAVKKRAKGAYCALAILVPEAEGVPDSWASSMALSCSRPWWGKADLGSRPGGEF